MNRVQSHVPAKRANPTARADVPPPLGKHRLSLILTRYVAVQFLLPLVCCLAGFILLFVIIDLFDVLQELVESRASLLSACMYFGLRQPANLVNILPMSLLLSCGYLVSNMLRHHELTAVRAAGVSLVHACLPVWVFGVLFSVLSLWLVEVVVPASMTRADVLLRDMTSAGKGKSAHTNRLAYRNSTANRDWFFESFDLRGEQHGVWIKQFRPDHGIEWEMHADAATYRNGTWVLTHGTRTVYDEDGQLPKDAGVVFETYEQEGQNESPNEILNSLRPAEDLSVRDMLTILGRESRLPASTRDVFETTIWFRLTFPFSCVVAVLLGISLSIGPHGGSRLRGFAAAIGILVAYYVCAQLFVLFGKNGMLPPMVAGSAPTLLAAGWGLWELYRKR